jgi:putative spermidine/putrescine transport system substrate-binding protein
MAMHRSATMSRRRLLQSGLALGAGALGLGALPGCGGSASGGSSGSGTPGITVFSWAYGFEATAKKTLIPQYKRKHPQGTVTLQVGTNAQMYNRIRAQKATNPVISGGTFNGLYSFKGRKDGLWHSIDRSRIPNRKDIDFRFSPQTGGVTFTVMPYCLAYNPTLTDKPASLEDLFQPKYKGKVGLTDNLFDFFMLTALMIGKDVDDVPAGINEWAKHKEQIGPWATSPAQLHEMLNNGELIVAADHGGLAEAARDTGLKVAFTVTKEGATPIIDCVHAIAGFDDDVAASTQDYLTQYLSHEAQSAWPSAVGGSPVDTTVAIPPQYQGREGIITPKDFAKLHTYDQEAAAAKIQEWTDLINRTLKS